MAAPMTNPKAQAINLLEAVQAEFPTPELAAHLAAVRAGQVDYWRNSSEMLVAIDRHARNSRGFFSMAMHDTNRARLDELIREHAPDVSFQA